MRSQLGIKNTTVVFELLNNHKYLEYSEEKLSCLLNSDTNKSFLRFNSEKNNF